MLIMDEFQIALKDFESFKQFIEENLKKEVKFLKTTHAIGNQRVSILNQLIEQHEPENEEDFSPLPELEIQSKPHVASKSLLPYIKYLLAQEADINLQQPIHLALKQKKLDIIRLLLNRNEHENEKEILENDTPIHFKKLDVNAKDREGYPLLAWAIETSNFELCHQLLKSKANVHEPYVIYRQGCVPDKTPPIETVPLFHAIKKGFTAVIPQLIAAGAQLDDRFSQKNCSPLMVAIQEGRVDMVKILFKESARSMRLQLNIADSADRLPIDVLCAELKNRHSNKEAVLQNIAILLAQGAKAPRRETDRALLHRYREPLLNKIERYTQKKTDLKKQFIQSVSDKNNALHGMFLTGHTFTSGLRYLFGQADKTAFKFWKLASAPKQDNKEIPFHLMNEEEKLSAFVERYQKKINTRTIFNPWSHMLWKITRGDVTTWQEVAEYAHQNPKSRTALIVNEMNKSGDEMNLQGSSFFIN